MSKVIVLGAKGRFGRAAVDAFAEAGWEVTAFGRRWTDAPRPGVRRVTGDATDRAALTAACMGQDVIVNALNPPYEDWTAELPGLTASVIAAAKAGGGCVLIPGNVYNYGAAAPEVLREDTPWAPTTRKGRLRVEMERAYRDAGVPTIILRGGDFIEPGQSGNWFESHIAVKAQRGRTMYPGPLDRVHAWAYLPDMARAAVLLAERRGELDRFAQFNYGGYALTGAEMVKQIEQAVGRKQKVSALPWWLIRAFGLVNPGMRELSEMRYLWQVPHRMDGSRLARMLPGFVPTPLDKALQRVLAA